MSLPLWKRLPAPLKAGERVREGNNWYTVERVSNSCAYLRAEYTTPKLVEIKNDAGEIIRSFYSTKAAKLEKVSIHSFFDEVAS